jgi:hypothetical protein
MVSFLAIQENMIVIDFFGPKMALAIARAI